MAEDVKQESKDIVERKKQVPQVTATEIDSDHYATLLHQTGKKVGDIDSVDATQADETGLTVTAPTPSKDDLGKISSTETVDVKDTFDDAEAAEGTVTKEIGNIQGELSEGALAEAQTDTLDPKATVKYQMADLMSSIEEGKELPPWASPAVRKVSAIMASRGMGASSMASAAMTQAVMESGIPIAAADAQSYAKIQLQNLNNKQQTALTNAATIAAMDTANLNARMTAGVENARNFLAMDTANLNNKQQANMLTYQSQIEGAFKDAAAINVTNQLNAKNEVQVEEFYAELGSQVEAANANRTAAMRQYNTSESNAMKQFNKQIEDSRDKFDASAQFAIDQSNVTWKREVNTANTAIQNETNRINVQNQFNAEQTALNALWQDYRDQASFNFQRVENAVNRKHAVGLMALEFSYNQKLLDEQEKTDLIELIGTFVSTWGDN